MEDDEEGSGSGEEEKKEDPIEMYRELQRQVNLI
jgi:hypothetical protein